MRQEDIVKLTQTITAMNTPIVSAYPDELQREVNTLQINMMGLYARRENILVSYPGGDLTETFEDVYRKVRDTLIVQ